MELEKRILKLAPWHYELPIRGNLSTSMGRDPRNIFTLINPGPTYANFCKDLFGDELQRKSVLDVACNCGGCLFYFSEQGARRCFGFEARKHWIDQAEFLLEHCTLSTKENIEIVQMSLDEFLSSDPDHFDITLFNGIFYHLPDPVHYLRAIASLTDEVIFINTDIIPGDGDHLTLAIEDRDGLLQGLDGLSFVPSGSGVLLRLLHWLGFEHTKVLFDSPDVRNNRGRALVVGSRNTPLS